MRSYLSKLPIERMTKAVKSGFNHVLDQIAPLEEVPPAATNSQSAPSTTAQTSPPLASAPRKPHPQIMTEPKKNIVNATQLSITLQASGAPVLKGLPEKRVAKILALGLAEIGKQLESVETGNLRVQGLGVFHVRNREVEKEGKKLKVRRVGFAASKPKQPKPKSAPPAGNADKKA
jgi:nucleoid DNA-binding protein